MKIIRIFWPVIFLIFLEALLLITNYIPGTYLLGWDNVMPEFNIGLNFKRAVFGVWQDYRGLGFLDGMAHTANLVHTIYIFILSTVLPQNLIRYAFLLVTHAVGGIAMYLLLKNLLHNSKFIIHNSNLSAMAGTLFYMFNLGVIQMFYAPLEVFAFHFAALPILALLLKNAFDKPRAVNLFLLFIVSLLLSPQGFVPTVFGVFLVLFAAIAVFDLIATRNFKKTLLIAFVVFAANAFWLLPYSYSVVKNSAIIQNTRINQFSSEEIFYRNKARGDFLSVLSLKGFMIDSIEYDNSRNQDIFFMQEWRNHASSIYFKVISILVAAFVAVGIIYSVLKRQKQFYPFILAFAISFIFLANNTPIFAQFNNLIRTLFPTIGEAFRFPFTKFIILFSFCFGVFFALGLSQLIKVLKKHLRNNLLIVSSQLLIAAAILIAAAPAFRGYFFSPLLKVELPNEYQEVFSYFSSQDETGRIALLPTYSFWNWQYRNWGHVGSGFIWYALPQPILERAFDPWSLYNEQSYNEFSYAVDKGDQELLENVLDKYDIKYILLDKTIQNSVTRGSINYPSIETLLKSTKVLTKSGEFGSLIIYEVATHAGTIYPLPMDVARVSETSKFANQDVVYKTLGNYVLDGASSDTLFILPSFYSGKLQNDLEYEVENRRDSFLINPKGQNFKLGLSENHYLVLPSLFENEFIIPVNIKASAQTITFSPIYPKVVINGVEYKPNEQTIVLRTSVPNATQIEFTDRGDILELTNGGGKAFLFNNYLNTVRIKNNTGREEISIVNTQNLTTATELLPLPSEEIASIEIRVEKFENILNTGDVIQSRLFSIRRKVDPLNLFPGASGADITNTDSGVELFAQGNSSVDVNFYRDNLPHQGSYIILVDSKYKSGLPLNFYIDNPFTHRPVLETKLSKTSDQNVIVLSPTEAAFEGYGFHFIAKAVGNEHSEGLISNVEVVPFPENTINNMRVVTAENSKDTQSVTPVGAKKINSSLYSVTIASNASHYLVLSESFDRSWRAYQVKTESSGLKAFLAQALPFLFGSEVGEHVEVNGWENGWILDGKRTTNSDERIIIVYLPQYLEYAGFLILGGTVIALILLLVRNKLRTSPFRMLSG